MGAIDLQCVLEQDARIHLVDLPVREFHRIGSFNRSMDSRLRGNDINMRRRALSFQWDQFESPSAASCSA